MKKAKIISTVVLLGVLASCNGGVVHDRLFTGKITRDCSGTYVKVAEKGDYLICNDDLVKNKKEGEEITLVYDFTTSCPEKDGKAVCLLYHENQGMIRIKSIK